MSETGERAAHQSQLMKRWFALLLIGAVGTIGLGVWAIVEGRTGAGIGYIGVAVADTLLVASLYAYRRRRS
jgi:hypothetical protein